MKSSKHLGKLARSPWVLSISLEWAPDCVFDKLRWKDPSHSITTWTHHNLILVDDSEQKHTK